MSCDCDTPVAQAVTGAVVAHSLSCRSRRQEGRPFARPDTIPLITEIVEKQLSAKYHNDARFYNTVSVALAAKNDVELFEALLWGLAEACSEVRHMNDRLYELEHGS